MATQANRKQALIAEILRLQQDFEALTDRSNALQHENNYFEQQISDVLTQVASSKQHPLHQQTGTHDSAAMHSSQSNEQQQLVFPPPPTPQHVLFHDPEQNVYFYAIPNPSPTDQQKKEELTGNKVDAKQSVVEEEATMSLPIRTEKQITPTKPSEAHQLARNTAVNRKNCKQQIAQTNQIKGQIKQDQTGEDAATRQETHEHSETEEVHAIEKDKQEEKSEVKVGEKQTGPENGHNVQDKHNVEGSKGNVQEQRESENKKGDPEHEKRESKESEAKKASQSI